MTSLIDVEKTDLSSGKKYVQECEPVDSLFVQDQRQLQDDRPWWQRNFFVHEPVLFGTWDGVFTSVMVNIFGVIIFLRMGWIVGTAGVGDAILLLLICATLALIPVLSAIGICERCQIQSGGIYFLISHVLGGQIGGAVGMLYSFGQAVATALVAVGFGESVAHLFNSEDPLLIKIVAIVVLVALTGINTAGVTWVIKIQLALLGFLLLAVADLLIGSILTIDQSHGIVGYDLANFRMNANSSYDSSDVDCSILGIDNHPSKESFFTVFGVFFANFLGVLAGVNMSGDLKDPKCSIPLGELAAVGVSSSLCFIFLLVLGAVSSRISLLCDSMIAERVSFTKLLFLAGLYTSSLSSILGSMYGAPRVMQSIASEDLIPVLKPLENGRGPNKIPVLASLVMTFVSLVFVIFGDLNQLAILSSMPFLITYAFVNYSYVSLAMTYDLQQVNNLSRESGLPPSYGSMGHLKEKTTASLDLDSLFPERTQKTIDPEDIGECKVNGDDRSTIIGQPQSWYSLFCNRYVALIGAIVNVFILLLVNTWFALFHLLCLGALYIYIGQIQPGAFSGISEFSLGHMLATAFGRVTRNDDEQVIVADQHPGVSTLTSRLNDDNEDYSTRKPYHHHEDRIGETLDKFD